jgi:hypothetical protein
MRNSIKQWPFYKFKDNIHKTTIKKYKFKRPRGVVVVVGVVAVAGQLVLGQPPAAALTKVSGAR